MGVRKLAAGLSFAAALMCGTAATAAQSADGPKPAYTDKVFVAAHRVQPHVVAIRRDIHEHPELSNREVRTEKVLAEQLRKLGLEVRTGIAHHGVIAVLRGGKPGGVVALRADMDGLPVKEATGLPFASKVTTVEAGETVPVMHACGHDVHMAMLMGAAEVLSGMKDEIPGTVVIIFQPAEEWKPAGEEAGAELLMKERALADLKPTAIFAGHVWSADKGLISVRSGGFFAQEDNLKITIHGQQAHGGRPWGGIDTMTLAGQIVTDLNTIVARQSDLTIAPAVVTIATIHGGVRSNIIPQEVVMTGTVRTLDSGMREDILKKVRRVVEKNAEMFGAKADLEIAADYPLTANDPALTAAMLPSIERAAQGKVDSNTRVITTSEDFSFYLKEIPGVYWLIGAGDPNVPRSERPENHNANYDIQEDAMEVGVRMHSLMALDYLHNVAPRLAKAK